MIQATVIEVDKAGLTKSVANWGLLPPQSKKQLAEAGRTARDELSASSLMLQLKCERRWAYQKLDGLQPPMLGRSGQIGSIGHRILAHAYAEAFKAKADGEFADTDSIVDAAVGAAVDAASAISQEDESRERAFAIATGAKLDEDNLSEVNVAFSGAAGALRKYLPTELKHYDLLGVEMPFRHFIPGIAGVAHKAVIDLVLIDRARRRILVIDHKFVGGRATSEAHTSRFDFDPQRRAYQWHLERAAPGYTVDFAYNVIRAKIPADVAIAKCCTKTACTLCGGKGTRLSKSPMDTTIAKLQTFLQSNPHLEHTERAQELLKDLRAADDYWSRCYMSPPPSLINGWLDEVRDAVRNRRSKARTGRWVKNRSQCSTVYGLCPRTLPRRARRS